jgi:hypothetical protein
MVEIGLLGYFLSELLKFLCDERDAQLFHFVSIGWDFPDSF